MNEDKFYIDELASIRAFCINSDKEDIYKYIYSLQQENQQLKEMIDEQDGCNKRRLQIFDLKDKLCKELKNIKILKQENKILRENAEHNGKVVDKVNWKNNLLQQRIDKAIEYLEQEPVIEVNGEFRNIYSEDDNKLLEILKGSGSNE